MYQRQKKILDMLQRGKVSIPSAAAELGVTEMTVRRDLKELEKRKLALLVKGGAIPFPARYEPEENELEHLERKPMSNTCNRLWAMTASGLTA